MHKVARLDVTGELSLVEIKPPQEIEKETDKLKYKLTILGDLLLDAIWYKDTDLLDFGSRVLSVLSFADFSNYVDSLNKLLFVEIPNAKQN